MAYSLHYVLNGQKHVEENTLSGYWAGHRAAKSFNVFSFIF